MEPTAEQLRKLYDHRFSAKERVRKDSLWQVLCQDFFQRWVSESDTVIDLGAGYCEFINHIAAARKFAVDLNDETPRFAAADVTAILTHADRLTDFEDNSVDVVFTSNLFEHIRSKDELVSILHELHRVLRPGKRLLVMMPNIRYAYKEFWDYFDHHLPLSHHSLAEVLELTDFKVVEVRSRFLPYTFKTRLPQTPFLLRLYLRLRLLHRFFGRQMFVVAEKIST